MTTKCSNQLLPEPLSRASWLISCDLGSENCSKFAQCTQHIMHPIAKWVGLGRRKCAWPWGNATNSHTHGNTWNLPPTDPACHLNKGTSQRGQRKFLHSFHGPDIF